MVNAYILMNTEIGSENLIVQQLKNIQGVKEAYSLWGVYDVIANIEANSIGELKDLITHQIGKLGKVNSKLTMIISKNAAPELQTQVALTENHILT
jgi:DNA-binding Lrp family transcriptional regulator